MKKILSITLVLAMLLGMVSMIGVLAADEPESTTWTKKAWDAIGENDTFAITVTTDGSTYYVLPDVVAGNASGTQNIPELKGKVDGNTLKVDKNHDGTDYYFGWTRVAVQGGYHIRSAENKLYMLIAASDNGLRTRKGAPDTNCFIFDVISMHNQLGATDGANYRTIGISNAGQWVSYKTVDGTTTANANSQLQDNVMEFWVLNTAHTCTDAPADGDHLCDTCQQPMADAQCADGDDEDHKCDDCNAVLCADTDPKDHKCDVCGADVSTCADGDDEDHKCDLCDAVLCADTDPADHKCDACGADVSTCADSDDEDHNCDTCGVSLCVDAENDGNHKCDTCGADVVFTHEDGDNNGHCDECDFLMCTEHKDETTKDHKCDICDETVSECKDKADDGDHNCDHCGKENVSSCSDSDTDADHKCDDCGKDGLNDCVDVDTDADHKCDVCGKDGLNECVDVDTDKDHKCDICGKDELNEHVWDPATIDAPKTCSICGATEGEPLPKSPTPEVSHWVKVDGLDKIGEGEYLVITITIEGKTYVLSNAEAKNSTIQPDLSILGEISEDGRFLTVGDGSKASGYNFTVVPVTGGFQIKSGNMDLWVAAGDTGLRISSAENAAVWNVGKCNLLVAEDPNGNWRTMCIRDNAWKSFKTVGNTADGNAHSTVRNNELGLWKYVPVTSSGGNTSGGNTSGGNTSGGNTGTTPSVPSNGDTALSAIIALMVISGMGLVATVSKKKEF